MDERTQKSRNFNLVLLSVFKIFLTFPFFLLLYLLVPTYTTFIRAPSYQNFHYFSISFENPRQPLVVYRSPALIITHRTRVVNPQLAARCSYQLHFGFNHAPPKPSHHSHLSVDPPLLPSRSLVGPLPCSFSTLPHINTNIHPSKQTPSCIHNFYCTFTALTN